MIIKYVVTGILMGIVFGFVLEKGRVFEPGMIIGQFQLRNFILLKMFLSAVAASFVVIGVLYGLGLVTLHPKAAVYPAVIVGGLIFGAGMALTGACPGTVLAQIGAGYRDAWAVLLGGIFGAMAYGYLEPALSSLNSGPGKITLADITGWPYSLLAFICAGFLIIVLFIMEKWRPWRQEMGSDYDGFF